MATNGPSKGQTEPVRDRFNPSFSSVQRRSIDLSATELINPPRNDSITTFSRSLTTGSIGAEASRSHTQPIGRRTELHFEESAKRLRELVELQSPRKKFQTAPNTEHQSSRESEAESRSRVQAASNSHIGAERHASTSPITKHGELDLRLGSFPGNSGSQGVHTPPADLQKSLGIRRQWELRTSQFEPLKTETNRAVPMNFPIPQEITASSSDSPSPVISQNTGPQSAGFQNDGSQKKLPSAKDLVERMIAYSRNLGHHSNTHASSSADPTRLPPQFAKLKSLNVQDNPPVTLAPSPLLSEKPGGGQQKQGNITMHTDLNAFKYPPLSRTAPIRPPPRFIRNPSRPASKNELSTYKIDGVPRGPLSNTSFGNRSRESKASRSVSLTGTPKTRPRSSSRVASTPPEIVVSESYNTPYGSTTQPNRIPAAQDALRPQEPSPANFTPNSDKSEAWMSCTDNSGEDISQRIGTSTRASSNQWKENQWRQFSIAMRDSIAEQKLSLKCAVSLLTGMRARLPPEMRGLSLDEIVKRLVVWINSTEKLQTIGAPGELS